MKYRTYKEITVSEEFNRFWFISIGKNGRIIKQVEFQATLVSEIYNLVFGDVDGNEGISDTSVSNNGDRNKILATVAYVVNLYLERYPERLIYFRGSTPERTRLYRMAIGLNL